MKHLMVNNLAPQVQLETWIWSEQQVFVLLFGGNKEKKQKCKISQSCSFIHFKDLVSGAKACSVLVISPRVT